MGTPDNLALQSLDRRRKAKLIFTITLILRRCFCPTGFLRDVDAGSMDCTRGFQNLLRSGTLCVMSSGMGHFRSNLRRDLRARLRRDFAVLLHCLGAGGASGKEFLKLFLIEFNDEEFYCHPEEPDICLRHSVLISRERSPQQSRHLLFCFRKCLGRCKISLSGWKVTTERFRLQKKEKM